MYWKPKTGDVHVCMYVLTVVAPQSEREPAMAKLGTLPPMPAHCVDYAESLNVTKRIGLKPSPQGTGFPRPRFSGGGASRMHDHTGPGTPLP